MQVLTIPLIISTLFGGIQFKDEPGWVGFRSNDMSNVINRVYPHTQAEQIGLQIGDKVLSLKPKNGFAGEAVTIIVERSGKTLEFRTFRGKKHDGRIRKEIINGSQ